MLKCPKCDAVIQIKFPADWQTTDMADLSREKRVRGGVGVIKCGECDYEGDPLEFDPRSLLPKVQTCYITARGMVIGFDAAGKQVTECQGFILAVGSELKIRCDGNTKWFFGKRESWLEEADFSWWWLEKFSRS